MRRALIAAALSTSLMAPGAGPIHLLDPLWALFTSLWNAPATKEGCGMDPNGRCKPAVQPSTDAGCGMDPDGRCKPGPLPTLDEGGGWDPSGKS